VRPFDTITPLEPPNFVTGGYAGMIIFNEEKLRDVPFPETFSVPLKLFQQTLSRQSEDSNAPIIALYLSYAVATVRQRHNTTRFVLLSDVLILPVDIPGLGLVGGKLDYVTAYVLGDGPLSN
jgi:hypothetical protein